MMTIQRSNMRVSLEKKEGGGGVYLICLMIQKFRVATALGLSQIMTEIIRY